MNLVTVPEMQAIEREADNLGLTYEIMMENAGHGLAEVVQVEFGHLKEKVVLGLVGSGNNGGDTLVALTQLVKDGWKATAYIVRPRPTDDPLIKRLQEAGGEIMFVEDDPRFEKLHSSIESSAVVLDGILGTGIKLPLKDQLAETMSSIRRILEEIDHPPFVVAVDCPSGVDCDNGDAAPVCIPADITVTMAAVKTGLLRFPAFNYVGEISVVSIGLESLNKEVKSWQSINRKVADHTMVRAILPPRPSDAHKGTFGTVMVVAGSLNFTGAALLAGRAAFRAGAGLITMAVPAPLHAALAGVFPEATWVLLSHEMGVIAESAIDVVLENMHRATAMLIGPGFGLEDTTRDFLSGLIGSSRPGRKRAIGFISSSEAEAGKDVKSLPPLVIDADGLKHLARIQDWAKYIPKAAVLTPHPGEMAVMTGLSVAEIQSDRIGVAERFAREWSHVVVLKGAHTVIASPDGQTTVIPVATPALARAGTGDVLSGIIVGLRAQGVDAYPAASAGCWIHAQAGLRAAQKLGSVTPVLAGDVLEAIVDVFEELQPFSSILRI